MTHKELPEYVTLLRASNEPSIEYQGKTLGFYHDFPVKDAIKHRIYFGGTHSNWKQGIRLDGDGLFVVDGKQYEYTTVIWAKDKDEFIDIAYYSNAEPTKHFFFTDLPPLGYFRVRNIWEDEKGSLKWNEGGAAMWVSQRDLAFVYCCNDGHLDGNFTDNIFGIESFVWVEKWPSETNQ